MGRLDRYNNQVSCRQGVFLAFLTLAPGLLLGVPRAVLAAPPGPGATGTPAQRAAASPARLAPKAALRLLRPALSEARHRRWDAAYLLAKAENDAYPDNLLLASAASELQQEAALLHLQYAHRDQAAGNTLRAAVEYRSALAIDPANQEAQRGLAAALAPEGAVSPRPDRTTLRVERAAPPVRPAFDPGRHDISFRGQSRILIGTVAAAYGLRAYVQDAVPDRAVTFAIGDATFAQAMNALHDVLGVDWTALDAHTLYFGVAASAAAFQPLAVRTFYFPGSEQQNELSEMVQLLRVILTPYRVDADTARHAITIRDRPDKLDAAERLLLDLSGAPGDVLFEVQIVATDDTVARQLGVAAPAQLQAVALGPILKQLQQSLSEQQLIQTLFSQGGLNALLNSGALSQQLGQLQSQLSPLLKTPFAVFGGGLTAMALTLPPASLNLSLTSARSMSLERAWLNSSSGEEASLKIGQRYPVVNATFSPILLSSAIQKVVANGSFLQPFPSFTFEDLGLNLTLTPYLAGDEAVSLKIQAQERALAGQGVNGIPILSDRQLQTVLELKNGEPAIIAGLQTAINSRTKTSVPVIGALPLLGEAFTVRQNNRQLQDLLVVITPHIVREPPGSAAPIWLPASAFARPLDEFAAGPRAEP